MRLLLFLTILPLWASDDATAILQRWMEAQKQNDERAHQYTFVQHTDWYTYGAGGELRKDRSETSEVIFVEGLEYQKLVTRNEQPLSPREQAKVDKEMRQTAAERRKRRYTEVPGGWLSFGGQRFDLGSRQELLTLFDSRVLGIEELHGRPTWVIEAVPKPGRAPASEHEKQVLSLRKKLWIDQADNVLVQQVCTVTGDQYFAKPGSTVTLESARIGPDTWHETRLILDVYRVRDKAFQPSGRTEYAMSQFQKFDVQSTITVDVAK